MLVMFTSWPPLPIFIYYLWQGGILLCCSKSSTQFQVFCLSEFTWPVFPSFMRSCFTRILLVCQALPSVLQTWITEVHVVPFYKVQFTHMLNNLLLEEESFTYGLLFHFVWRGNCLFYLLYCECLLLQMEVPLKPYCGFASAALSSLSSHFNSLNLALQFCYCFQHLTSFLKNLQQWYYKCKL
jgi:hypothetical protein